MTAISDTDFRCPRDLMVTETPLRRVLIVGSCLVSGLPMMIEHVVEGCSAEYFIFNNLGELPTSTAHPPSEYDFQVVQIALRSVLPDSAWLRFGYHDTAACERLFIETVERLQIFLLQAMKWNIEFGIPTFVYNFVTPQQNPMGRLLPRYDLRNPVYFMERLNQALANELQNYSNAYLFDLDQIISTYGRRYFSDDVVAALNHGAGISDVGHELDLNRLEPVEPGTSYYPINAHIPWIAIAELVAMYRTIRRSDEVKLVIVDVDDTLWRGVAAEDEEINPNNALEGWPLGIIEALGFLKKRGILLAIVSKNDEERLGTRWQTIMANRLALDDFAVRKVNWRPKVENFAEILAETNLLPRNVLYIDDNPVERASIQAAFPEVRVLGPNPYLWRRILLWSAETQVAQVTAESARRTEMVQAQVQRETQRRVMSREEFLHTLDLRVTLSAIDSPNHPHFARSLELINKTNQFNTTGRRWTAAEANDFLIRGGRFYSFDAQDKFTSYGTIGVAALRGGVFEQFVMSCRVVGMDVEFAAIAEIVSAERAERGIPISAKIVETDANSLCRELYSHAGFEAVDGTWQMPSARSIVVPAHIAAGRETTAATA